MATSMTMAEQAVSVSSGNYSTRDKFAKAMQDKGLSFTGWTCHGSSMEADYLLFSDGSGFFADNEEGKYMLWPNDAYNEDEQKHEYLALLGASDKALPADTEPYTFQDLDPDIHSDIAAHLKGCVSEHPDPPEAMRSLILKESHPFEWVDRDQSREVQEMLVLCAILLHPEVQELALKSDARPGVSPAQKRSDDITVASMINGGFMSDNTENMTAYYASEPHVEINEGSDDYKEIQRANEPLAWLSRKLLVTHGRPTGWEVDYNDGHRTRMSGFSAHSDSIVIDVNGVLSNHQRVQKEQNLASYLEREGLLEDFQGVLSAHGFPRLPGAEV